jgi:hypothetical protein
MMKSSTRQFAILATSVALLSSTFVPLRSAQADGDLAPFDPSTILSSPVLESGELLAFDMNRIVSTQTRLIRYEATEYQRKVAEQRARAFMAAHRKSVAAARQSTAKEVPKKSPKSKGSESQVAENRKKESQTPEKSKKGSHVAEKPEKETPVEPKKETKTAAKPEELPRYIAVDTVKDKRASPKAKKVVMIWDTHAEALVGNNIYDVQNPPRIGETKVFETYSAEYIGAGL